MTQTAPRQSGLAATARRGALLAALAPTLALVVPLPALGGMTYTDIGAYQSAIASGFQAETVEGFDGATAPQAITDGGSYNDLTFDLAALGVDLTIRALTDATASNNNGLGAEGDDFFEGDGFGITLASPMRAFGLFVVSGNILADDDIGVSAGGETVQLRAADAINRTDLTDNYDFTAGSLANLYFLGLIADADFSAVTLSSSDAGGSFSFTLDDLRYAAASADVPVPATGLLLAGGLGLLAVRRRRASLRREMGEVQRPSNLAPWA